MTEDQEFRNALALGASIFAIVTIATAPIWLPIIFGVEPKRCKCGTELTPTGICPYCECYY